MGQKDDLTTRDAAQEAGVTDGYIRALLIDGTLRGHKLNGWLWIIDRRSFDEWLASRKPRKR